VATVELERRRDRGEKQLNRQQGQNKRNEVPAHFAPMRRNFKAPTAELAEIAENTQPMFSARFLSSALSAPLKIDRGPPIKSSDCGGVVNR